MKNILSRLVGSRAPAAAEEGHERLARIEAQLARTGERLDALGRMERQLTRNGAQLDFLNTHGASYLGDGIALTHLPDETPIFINSNDYGSPMNFLSGGRYEEDNISLLMSFLDDASVFVDVGANLGFFSLRVAQRLRDGSGKVLAFEPQPHMVELLRRTLHLNGLSERVELHPFALSDRAGTALLEIPVGHRGAGHIPSALTERWQSKQDGPSEGRVIELRRLDDVVAADFRCDLIKIDVEGHELEALQGMRGVLARSPKVGVLFEKMIANYGNEQALWRHFEQLGFRLYGVGDEATLRPFRTVEALIAWDRGNVFASRDPTLPEKLRRRRFCASARQLRMAGEARWSEDGSAVDIEGRDTLVFGPYWSLPRGQWRLRLDGHADRPIDAIIKDRVGLLEVARLRLEPGQGSADFFCDHDLVNFECVLHAIDRQPTQLRLAGVEFERIDHSSPLVIEESVVESASVAAKPTVIRLPEVAPHAEAARRSSTRAKPRITVFSNCQGEIIASAIQAFTGCRMPSVQAVGQVALDQPALLVEPLRELARHHDIILMQPSLAEIVMPEVPDLADRIALFPNLTFSAFHPDICYVFRRPGAEHFHGPMGPYHSSIAYHAWRAGMSTQQTLDHYTNEVYEALRFHDYWQASARTLCAEGRAANLPLEGLLERWRAHGCFMHTHNHPMLPAVVDVARALLLRMGLEVPAVEPADFLHDSLASGPVWPVYPEIAARLGVTGSTTFKASNGNQDVRTSVRLFDLEAFVEESFAAFASVDPEQLRCDRPFSKRYQEVFGKAAQQCGSSAPATAARQPSRNHPYAELPARQFWRSAVAGCPVAEVDPVIEPSFQLDSATRVATAGSCFAQHISRRLQQRGFNHLVTEQAPAGLDAASAARENYGVYSARYGNLYTARQLLQLHQRAYGELVPGDVAWMRPDGRLADPFRPEISAEGFADLDALLAARAEHFAAVRQMFETVEVFVFTLGLTEAWRAKGDGAVFPLAPGVVAGEMSGQYEFHNFDVNEVMADLEAFIGRLATKNPQAKILFTVSPVPLIATYEPQHVLAASIYSKSVLRVAAEAMARRHAHCSYFPSFEIITGNFSRGSYYGADLRSVNAAGVDHVMRLFFAHYAPSAVGSAIDPELLEEAGNNYKIVCEEARLDPPAA